MSRCMTGERLKCATKWFRQRRGMVTPGGRSAWLVGRRFNSFCGPWGPHAVERADTHGSMRAGERSELGCAVKSVDATSRGTPSGVLRAGLVGECVSK